MRIQVKEKTHDIQYEGHIGLVTHRERERERERQSEIKRKSVKEMVANAKPNTVYGMAGSHASS